MIFGCGSLGYSPITFVHLKEKLKFTSILLVKNRKGYELKVHNLQLEYPIVDPKYWNIDNFVKNGGGCCMTFSLSVGISQGAHKVPAKRSIFGRKLANEDRERERGGERRWMKRFPCEDRWMCMRVAWAAAVGAGIKIIKSRDARHYWATPVVVDITHAFSSPTHYAPLSFSRH